ncbi:lysosomal proton-coupled steroid conjugate and bile acid symporter SLC46A3-like [Liolophura sinensis]|uniref:lysosomal proton-coupled steroid conjugate and bile acid symporter SLC46A3-like n=1 Tax=Liolophura sinensis TaxID=3198878 RepID=UPI0031587254
MTCRHTCKSFFKGITVEPVLFVYMLASFLQFPATQGLAFSKVCLLKYNSTQFCERLRHNDTPNFEETFIQSKTSLWITFLTISLTAPSILTTAFIGSWGDKIDRKLPLILPCIGGALSSLCFLINSVFVKLPLPVLLVGPILNGLTGGFVTMIMATFSYVTHVSETRSRTSRVAVVEAMSFIAGTLGVILMGIILDRASFTVLFSLTSVLFVIALMYVLIFVKKLQTDCGQSQSDQRLRQRLGHYFNVTHVKESMVCAFRRRDGHNRLHLWILFSVIAILMICTSGQMDILLLFVRHSPLSWSYGLYGYLQGLHNGLRSLLLLSLLPLLKKIGLRDSTLVLTGLVSKVAGLVLLGLSSKTWMVFLVPVVSMLEGYPSAGCRSLMSRMVEKDEQGKIFGAVASIESIATLLASVIFNNIYSATQFYPGLTFQIMAGLCSVSIGLMLLVHIHLIGNWYSDLVESEAQEEPTHTENIQDRDDDDSSIAVTR